MSDYKEVLMALYGGWHNYQNLLINALAPLTPEQLALRPAPHLRSIEQSARHIIRARASWFYYDIGQGQDNPELKAIDEWDDPNQPARSVDELVAGLNQTWALIQNAFDTWTPERWAELRPNDPGQAPENYSLSWIIWHLIEHDVHHGGEISLILGMNKLAGPDI